MELAHDGRGSIALGDVRRTQTVHEDALGWNVLTRIDDAVKLLAESDTRALHRDRADRQETVRSALEGREFGIEDNEASLAQQPRPGKGGIGERH